MKKIARFFTVLFGILAAFALVAFVAFVYGMAHQERLPTKDAFDSLPSLTHQVKIVQKRAGCIKIDAKIGPESITKINAAVKREQCQEYCDIAIACMPKENQ